MAKFSIKSISADIQSPKELLRANTYGRSWLQEIYTGYNTWNEIMDRKADKAWIQEQRIAIKEGYTSDAFDSITQYVQTQPDDVKTYEFALERFNSIAENTKVRDPNSPLVNKAMILKKYLNRERGELSEVEDIKKGIQSKNEGVYSEWAFVNLPPTPGWKAGEGAGSTEDLIEQGLEYYNQYKDRLSTMNRFRGEIKIDIEEEKKFLEYLKSYIGHDGMIDSIDFQNAREGLTLSKVYEKRLSEADYMQRQIDGYVREMGGLEEKISLYKADTSAFSKVYTDKTPTETDYHRLRNLPGVISKLRSDKGVLDEYIERKRFDATGLESGTVDPDLIDLDDPLDYENIMTKEKYIQSGRKSPFSKGQSVEFNIGGITVRGKVKTFHASETGNWEDEMVTILDEASGKERKVLVSDIRGATVGAEGKTVEVKDYSGMRLLSGQAAHGVEDVLSKGLIEEIEAEANLGVSLDDYIGGIDLNTGMIYAESGESVYKGGKIKKTEIGTKTVGTPSDLWRGFGVTLGFSGSGGEYTPQLHSDEHQTLEFDKLFKAMKDGGLQPVKLSPKLVAKIKKEVSKADLLKQYNKDLTNVSLAGKNANISEDSSLSKLNNDELDISKLSKPQQKKVILFAKDYNKLIEEYNSADPGKQDKLRKRFTVYDKHLNKLLKSK